MKITIHIRIIQPSDKNFIESLTGRFSEFDLPEWRSTNELDQTNRMTLQNAIEQPEPDSVIFIAEDESSKRAGFVHLQTQTDYFNGEKHGLCWLLDSSVSDSEFLNYSRNRATKNRPSQVGFLSSLTQKVTLCGLDRDRPAMGKI